jgi:hypothetical protein
MAGSCGHGNEPSGSLKSGEFLELFSGYWLLNKDSAPWNYLILRKTIAEILQSV